MPAMRQTSATEASAPTNAASCTPPSSQATPVMGTRKAIAAPSAAPLLVPSTYGSASGLRSSDWNAAPEVASAAPTAIAARIRGSRISITIEVAPALMSLPTGRPKRLFPMIASTSSGAMFATPKPTAPTATSTSAASVRSVVRRTMKATEGSLDVAARRWRGTPRQYAALAWRRGHHRSGGSRRSPRRGLCPTPVAPLPPPP